MKLPDINYGRVGALPQENPSDEVQAFQQKQNVVQAITNVTYEAVERNAEYSANKANAGYRDFISEFDRDMATRATFTPDEIKEMGLDDRIDTIDPETGKPVAWLPKSAVYAIALQDRMRQGRELFSGQIKNAKYRNAWLTDLDDTNSSRLDREIENSAKLANQELLDIKTYDFDVAVASGQFETANDILNDSQVAGLLGKAGVKQKRLEISKAEQTQDFTSKLTDWVAGENVDELLAEAKRLRLDDTNEEYAAFDDKELNVLANQFEQAAKTVKQQAKTNQSANYNRIINDYWATGSENPAQMVAGLPELHEFLLKNGGSGLDVSDRKAINTYADAASKGKPITTNIATWYMLDQMSSSSSSDELARFRDMNLLQYAGEISVPNMQDFMKLQSELKSIESGDGDITSYMTTAELKTAGLQLLGFRGNRLKDAKASQIKLLFATQLQLAEQEKGKKLNDTEKQKVINDTVMVEYKNRNERMEVYKPLADLDQKQIRDYSSSIADAGRTINATSLEVASQLDDDGIELTDLNFALGEWLLKGGQMINEKSIAAARQKMVDEGLL